MRMARVKKKKAKRSFLTLFLCGSLLLSGCGSQKLVVPELDDPISDGEYYIKAEIGEVGYYILREGVIVPNTASQYWKTTSTVDEIYVHEGEYVEKGQLLAEVDRESVLESLKQAKEELENEYAEYDLNCRISASKYEESEYRLKGAREKEAEQSVADLSKTLKMMDENARYEELMHNFRVRNLEERIAELNELADKGQLFSTASGYVSYVKDLSKGNVVTAYENVVDVSDYTDFFVRFDGLSSDDYDRMYKNYKSISGIVGGEKKSLVKYEFTREETIQNERNGRSMAVRMRFEDETVKLEIGSTIMVYFQKEIPEKTLKIDNAAVYSDDDGSYVYVKSGETREVRRVETGLRDKWYTQILSGLEEGEEVYMEAQTAAPANYVETEITREDFAAVKYTQGFSNEVIKNRSIYATQEGVVSEILVSNKQEVKKGDVLFTMEVDEGEARLADIRSEMEKLKLDHETALKEIDSQILENEKAIEVLKFRSEDKTAEEEKNGSAEKETSAKDEEKSTEKPADTETTEGKTTEEPTEVSSENVTEQATENTTEQAAEKATENTTEQAAEQATENTTEKATEQATENTTEQATEQATEQTTEQTTEQATEQTEEQYDDPYLPEEMNCRHEQLVLRRLQENSGYERRYDQLQEQYNKVRSENNGSGVIEVLAERSGIVSDINIHVKDHVKAGTKLYNIGTVLENCIIVKVEDVLHLNQKIEVSMEDGRSYSGVIIGLTGKYYYAKMDDESYFKNIGKGTLSYHGVEISNTIVLDTNSVFTEVSKFSVQQSESGTKLNYVWKVTESGLSKQYVEVVEEKVHKGAEDTIGNLYYCVMSGIKEGDRIITKTGGGE